MVTVMGKEKDHLRVNASCSAVQCGAVCCSVVQCVECVAVCCSVLQCVVVWVL